MLEDALQLRTQFGKLQTVDILLIGWRVRMLYILSTITFIVLARDTKRKEIKQREYHEMALYKVALISLL